MAREEHNELDLALMRWEDDGGPPVRDCEPQPPPVVEVQPLAVQPPSGV